MDYDWLFGESSNTSEDSLETSQPWSLGIDVHKYYESVTEVSEEPIWTTATGDKIPLSKMETRHIVNCMRLLGTKKPTGFIKKWLAIFGNELAKRRSTPLERGFSL